MEIFNLKKMLGEEEDEIEAIHEKMNKSPKRSLKRGSSMILENLQEQIEKWNNAAELIFGLEAAIKDSSK